MNGPTVTDWPRLAERDYARCRAAVMDSIGQYILNEPIYRIVSKSGGYLALLRHEGRAAEELYAAPDLSSMELAAAHALCCLSRWREITLAHEHDPTLEPEQAAGVAGLAEQTRQAVADFATFLPERLAGLLTIAETAAPVTVEQDGGPVPNWKLLVQAEAAAMFKRQRAMGAQPTVYNIVDAMARWCRENDVRTSTGAFPSASYLRVHVLGGKHWKPPE